MSYKQISPIPVTEGGTGVVTSTTAYAPICGGTTATGAFQAASTGLATSGWVLTSNGNAALPSFQALPSSSISITGDTGGALVNTAFTFTGGTTGLSFDGAGSTQTLTFAGITANGGTVSLATDATASTINIGTGAGVKTSTFGSTNSTSSTTVQSGSGALAITSTNGSLTINSGTGALGISTDASATTVSFATGGAVKTVTLGSTNSTSATTIQSGSGALALTSTNGTWTGNSGTGALGLSTDASATTISLGTGGAVKTITLGSTNTSSTTTIQGGTGGIQLSGTFVNMPTTSSTVGQIRINNNRFVHGYGTANTFLGESAGNFTTSGTGANVSVGYLSGGGMSTGNNNTFVGAYSGNGTSTGANNIAIGSASYYTTTGGTYNIAIGPDCMRTTSSAGSGNIAMGRDTLTACTGGSNVAIGYQAGNAFTSGNNNVLLGASAGSSLATSDSSNILVNHVGVGGVSNRIILGGATGTGTGQISTTFVHGIYSITAAGTTLSVPMIDSNGQLATASPNSSTIGLSTDATSSTINIGTGGAVKAVTLGSTNSTSSTTINFGGSSGSALSTYITGGTFVPVLSFGGGTTGITYSTQTGSYSRIGNIIVFTMTIVLTNKGSSTGAAAISGLPTNAAARTTLSITFDDFNTLATFEVPSAYIGSASSSITLIAYESLGGVVSSVTNDNFLNTSKLYISGSYLV